MRGQDGLHADLRVIGSFDQPVVRLDRSLVSLSCAAERAPRHRAQRLGKLAQPRIETPVTQVRASKFIARPFFAVQALGDLQRNQCEGRGGCGNAQARAQIRLQLVHVDRLDRFGAVVLPVLATPPGLRRSAPIKWR